MADGCFLASRREPTYVRIGHTQILVRIDGDVVDANFVVQVRTGAAPAIADVADSVAAVHVLSGEDRKAGQVAVTRRDSVAMVNRDSAPVAAQEVGEFNHALCRSHHRLAVRRTNVNSGVERTFTVKWINALTE